VKVLILDNYDSFTYNLYHYVQSFTDDVTVERNDAITLEEIRLFSHIIISPGPGLPESAGITLPLIREYAQSKSILGICLGCQALAEHFRGELYNQNEVAHGRERKVHQTTEKSWLLSGLPPDFKVGLYHSWAVRPDNLPDDFRITALSEKGVVMALEHKSLPLAGVQFHPESIMSEHGKKIIENWLSY